MNNGIPDAKDCCPDCRLDNTDIQHGVPMGDNSCREMIAKLLLSRAVGSAAPWFLTGWAEGTEVEFIINTGCQVMILGAPVCWIYWLLPKVHTGFCRTVGALGSFDTKRGRVCLD